MESEPVSVWAGEVHRILGSRDPEIPSEGSERRSGLGVSTTAAKHGKEVPRLHSARVLPTFARRFIEPDDGELDHHSTST